MKKHLTLVPDIDADGDYTMLRKTIIHCGGDPDEVSRTKNEDLWALFDRNERQEIARIVARRGSDAPVTWVTPAPAGFMGFDGDAA